MLKICCTENIKNEVRQTLRVRKSLSAKDSALIIVKVR